MTDDGDFKVRHVDWYFDEWIAGTAKLDVVERGIYVTICNMIYSEGGPIDSDGLASVCKCHGTSFKRAIKRLETLGKIIINGSKISVKRCTKELEKARNRLVKATENGAKGGRPSNKINDLEKPAGYFPENLPRASFNLQPPTSNHQPIKTRAKRASSNEAFDRWYEGYPRKDAVAAARKAFPGAMKKTSLDELIAGVKRYIANKPPTEAYCLPATWLNQERWLDASTLPASKLNGHSMFDTGPTEPAPTVEGFEVRSGRPH